ncbi:MAG: lysylphosphatidylglycerol synthase domain-containing protein [Geminicoccaceae bacterium]
MRSGDAEAAAVAAGSSPARLLGALAWLVGLGLVAGLIATQNQGDIAAAITVAGWSIALVGLAHLGTLLADTLGWRALFAKPHQPPLGSMMVKRWIGASVNGLLPVAQIGGEFVRARLLARAGVAGPIAGASVVVDLTAGLVTQVLFIVLGIVLYLEQRQAGAGWLLHLAGGLALFCALLFGFGMAQRRGLFLRLARILERATRGRAWRSLVGSAAALDREIVARYADRARLSRCACWRFLGWLWGSVEIWLAFWLLGHPVGLIEAVILESLGQALRSAGFVLPGGLGAQEGGIVAGALALGIAPDLALAVALIKRARELAYGVPGLVAWSLTGLAGQRA